MASVSVRYFLLPSGKLQIFVDNGTEDQAKTATRKILATLKAEGIEFSEEGDIELHRTGGGHVHVVTEVQQEVKEQ